MLFNINKNDNNEINFVELINVLRLKTITITNRDNQLLYGDEETYYDILINYDITLENGLLDSKTLQGTGGINPEVMIMNYNNQQTQKNK